MRPAISVASLVVAGLTVAAGLDALPLEARVRHRCVHCVIPVEPFEPPPVQGPVPNVPYGSLPDAGVPDDDLSGGHRVAVPRAPQGQSYAQGFVLTYTVHHDGAVRSAGTLHRYADVGRALAQCWEASDVTSEAWTDVTIRVSFRRDGSINGVPRIQHLEAPGGDPALSRLRTGFLSTLGRCVPLSVSPSLGAAIAGQIFAIRFIQPRNAS